MIKNIFFPEKIKGYYLFPKRVLGIDIGTTHINATKLLLQGNNVVIEKCFEEKLPAGNTTDHDKRVSETLKKIITAAGKYDAIHSTLSSSQVVFKELKLPFANYDKIQKIVNFEVEPLLPFSLSDAVVDFIITKKIPKEQSSEILVAAVQKQHITHHLFLFEQAGIEPKIIMVDLFALYGLYKSIPKYAQQKGSVTLIDFGFSSTRVAYIHDGQLRFIRTIPQGMLHIAKTMSSTLNIQPPEAMEYIVRFGLQQDEQPEYTQALKDTLTSFLDTIQFTLQSFVNQTAPQNLIKKMLLLGGGVRIKELPSLMSDILHIPCEPFKASLITKNETVSFKGSGSIPIENTISLSAAFPSAITEHFNLRRDEFSPADTTLLNKQLIAIIILLCLIVVSLFTHSFIQIGKLQREASASENETVTTLQEHFTKLEDEDDLEEIVEQAEQIVKEEEKLWFSFSSRARSSFLHYLLELTEAIDKDALGFEIKKLTISKTEGTTPDIMILDAQVKDYEALGKLEEQLQQSKLFKEIEPQDEPDFTMKIILAPLGEEQ